uniref:Phospholipase A2 n=1 Tax=Hadrurus spadix TaxID=141984 RepID=A0A1W7RA22_9SCOR
MKTSLVFVLATLSLAECVIFDSVSDVLPLTTTFYREKDGHRMVETIDVNTYLSEKKTIDCYMYGDNYIIDRMLELVPESVTKESDKAETSKLVNQCSDLLLNELNNGIFHSVKSPFDSVRKAFKSLLIFPGTKWCGAGNVADNYEDLGRAEQTDKCCRTHDHCNDTIPGYGTKYGLKNENFYTKSTCPCDLTFHSCLYEGNNLPSDLVGKTFFNILLMQCFKKEYPQIGCLQKTGIILRSCQEYKFDYNGTKKYQFFDAKTYEPKENASILGRLLSG